MSKVRWLHISDLHFNSDDMSTSRLRERLPQFLKEKNIRCGYVFCTGDIRTAGARRNAFTDEAAVYLKTLCAAVGTTTERLFIVPGNHDINRDALGREDAIKNICFQRKGNYQPKYGNMEEADLVSIHRGQKEFREFLSKVYTDAPERLKWYQNPVAPHFDVETSDFNILHVDTTLTQTAGQETSDLVIGTRLLQQALRSLNDEKPTILLTHFPFTSLWQEERKYVGELLHEKGVRLWLAGHEHDHMLQPMGYLDSIQAGELRMEEQTNATVLVGEYDTETYTGKIVAYTWFPQGWAKYPIIWHDGKREDEYPFSLRLPGDNGKSREAIKAENANKRFSDRLPTCLIRELIPDLITQDGEILPKLSHLLTKNWNTPEPNLIIRADGGMGKTTMLLSSLEEMDVALYIPVESLDAMDMQIQDYCAGALFEGNQDDFEQFCSSHFSSPNLILLIDGMNEVDGNAERRFINEIKRLDMLPGIQIVITSRSNFTSRYSMSGYRTCKLVPLSDDQIHGLFADDVWGSIKDRRTLHHLLSNPMMLTMYIEISPIMEKYHDVEFLNWKCPIENATDLLHNFYASQIAVLLDRSGVDGAFAVSAWQAVFEILPGIAYHYESRHLLNLKNEEYRKILASVIKTYEGEGNRTSLALLQEQYRYYQMPEIHEGVLTDVLTESLHLLYKNQQLTAFPHQIYRDYLTAVWIVSHTDENCMEDLWNSRMIPIPIMEHIRNLSGAYWNGIAHTIHQYILEKTDGENRLLVSNLLECFTYSEQSKVPDFSGLDLRGICIPDVNRIPDGRVCLNNALLDERSIGKDVGKQVTYTHLTFSHGNEYLAANAGTKVFIFSLQNDDNTFMYTTRKEVTRFAFAGRYLLAAFHGWNAGIYVFALEENWQYVGEIKNSNGANDSIFNKRLHNIILDGDVLHFYFNNRELQYTLSDCCQTGNKAKQHAWESAVLGIDLTYLKEKENRKTDKSKGLIWRTNHNGLEAVSTIDGGLIVQRGSEVQHILSRGVTLLKDGSISGDGSKAVTLSYDLFFGKRKVQIWNLDEQRKTGEISCPAEVEQIHMSETGAWIIGTTPDRTWVFNKASGEETWYNGHFISNQHRKVSTYGDKVLRKNSDRLLYLYDLKTGEVSLLDNPCKDAKLACFMSDGSIAVVDNNAREVRFKNIRTGEYSKVNNQLTSVIGLQGLKEQPFIAVATQDNMISIYHIGDGLRKRKLPTKAGNYMMVVHPELSVIANSNGQKRFETHNFFEKTVEGRRRGWWYDNPYGNGDPAINGDVLDLAFNTKRHELVVILSNGQIMFCHEKYCRYHSTTEIITNFNVDAYDFRGCICDEKIKQQLRQNGALID